MDQEFQNKLSEWRNERYPNSDEIDIALKLGEEVGEVLGAVFKYEWNVTTNRDNIREEIGDAGLTLASLCQYNGWDFNEVLRDRAIQKGMIDGS